MLLLMTTIMTQITLECLHIMFLPICRWLIQRKATVIHCIQPPPVVSEVSGAKIRSVGEEMETFSDIFQSCSLRWARYKYEPL